MSSSTLTIVWLAVVIAFVVIMLFVSCDGKRDGTKGGANPTGGTPPPAGAAASEADRTEMKS